MTNTKQMEQTRDEKGRITGGTPPKGFNAHPENRHNGAWKKEDTPRFKLEQMMKLSEKEIDNIIKSEEAPKFEKKLAEALRDGNWNVIREMIDQVYGKAKESVDMTSNGETIGKTVEVVWAKKKK